MKVTTDAEGNVPYTGDWYASVAGDSAGAIGTVHFSANGSTGTVIPAGTTLYVWYTTTITDVNQTSYTNTTWLHYNGDPNDSASATYHKSVYLYKSAISNSNGVFNWLLKVEKLDASANSVTVTDTLPANQSYVAGSVSASNNYYYDGATKYSGVTAVDNGDGTVTFTVAGDALAAAKAGTEVQIGYQTKIADINAVASGATDYVNTAKITVDGTDQTTATADAWANKPDILAKGVDYSTATAPFANYTVDINPAAFDLNSDGNSIV